MPPTHLWQVFVSSPKLLRECGGSERFLRTTAASQKPETASLARRQPLWSQERGASIKPGELNCTREEASDRAEPESREGGMESKEQTDGQAIRLEVVGAWAQATTRAEADLNARGGPELEVAVLSGAVREMAAAGRVEMAQERREAGAEQGDMTQVEAARVEKEKTSGTEQVKQQEERLAKMLAAITKMIVLEALERRSPPSDHTPYHPTLT